MIDPLLHQMLDQAVDAGTDGNGGHHYTLAQQAPDAFLKDLRFAGRTELVTVWQSPRFRALLLASEHSGRLVLYENQRQFATAVRDAGRGYLPELERGGRER